MKISKFKIIKIIFISFIILIPLLVIAYGTRDTGYIIDAGYCTQDMRVPLASGATDPVKYKICNNGVKDYFIPTKTWAEWSNFFYNDYLSEDVLNDLTSYTYCGDGVCQQSDYSTDSCCSVDCPAPSLCHGDGICSFAELPVGYYYYATGDPYPADAYNYASVDCKWCSSNDYPTNFFNATGMVWSNSNGCWTQKSSLDCSAGWWPSEITIGYDTFPQANCTGDYAVWADLFLWGNY